MWKVITSRIDELKSMPESAKASVAYAGCSILNRSMSFITLPLFTRLLTTEQYGQATIYTSWSVLISVFVSLYLPYGTFSKAMIKFEDDRDGYIASANAVCLLLGCLFLVIYLPLSDWLDGLFELPTYIICFMIVSIVTNNALECWMAKQRFAYKYVSVVKITLVSMVLSPFLAFFFVICTEEKGYARIIGGGLIGVIIGSYFWIREWIKGKHLYQRRYWHYALSFNIPLIPYYLAQMIYNQSDRIMISHLVGTDKAGIYGVAYNLALALGFVLSSINNSYIPWLYRQMKDGNWHRTRAISFYIAVFISMLLMFVILFTPEIILIMAGEAYREAVWCVPPIAMSLLMTLYAQFFVNVEFYFEKKSCLVIGMMCSGIANVILNYLLIPSLGFVAAAYTTLFSFTMTVVINYFFYKKILSEKSVPDVMYDYRNLIVLAVGFLLASLGVMLVYDYAVIRIIIAMIISFIMVYKKDMIMLHIKTLKA